MNMKITYVMHHLKIQGQIFIVCEIHKGSLVQSESMQTVHTPPSLQLLWRRVVYSCDG